MAGAVFFSVTVGGVFRPSGDLEGDTESLHRAVVVRPQLSGFLKALDGLGDIAVQLVGRTQSDVEIDGLGIVVQ